MGVRSPSANGAQGRVPSRCTCSTDAPSPSAYAAQLKPSPSGDVAKAVQMWEGRAQSSCICGIVERSPGATGPSPVPAEMWQGRAQSRLRYCTGAGRVPWQMSQASSAGYLLVVSSTWIGDAMVSSEMVLELTVVPAGNRNEIVAGVIGAVGHLSPPFGVSRLLCLPLFAHKHLQASQRVQYPVTLFSGRSLALPRSLARELSAPCRSLQSSSP